MDRGSNVMD